MNPFSSTTCGHPAHLCPNGICSFSRIPPPPVPVQWQPTWGHPPAPNFGQPPYTPILGRPSFAPTLGQAQLNTQPPQGESIATIQSSRSRTPRNNGRRTFFLPPWNTEDRIPCSYEENGRRNRQARELANRASSEERAHNAAANRGTARNAATRRAAVRRAARPQLVQTPLSNSRSVITVHFHLQVQPSRLDSERRASWQYESATEAPVRRWQTNGHRSSGSMSSSTTESRAESEAVTRGRRDREEEEVPDSGENGDESE